MSEDNKPRYKDPNDYDRAQPTQKDREVVAEFLSREMLSDDLKKYGEGSQFERKLGLLVAMFFNKGFEAGVKSVREENGFFAGYNEALRICQNTLNQLPEMEDK